MDKKQTPNSKKKIKKVDSKDNKSPEQLRSLYETLLKEDKVLDTQIEVFQKNINLDLTPQMNALHEYNEMKDLAQLVMGYLADAEHVSITELHHRYNLPTD